MRLHSPAAASFDRHRPKTCADLGLSVFLGSILGGLPLWTFPSFSGKGTWSRFAAGPHSFCRFGPCYSSHRRSPPCFYPWHSAFEKPLCRCARERAVAIGGGRPFDDGYETSGRSLSSCTDVLITLASCLLRYCTLNGYSTVALPKNRDGVPLSGPEFQPGTLCTK